MQNETKPADAPEINAQPSGAQPSIEPDLGAEFDALAAEAGAAPGDPAAAVPDIPTKQALALFLGPLFAVLAPAWGVEQAEIDLLADAYAPVVDKYFPGGMGVEGTAILATAIVFAPRLGKPRKAQAEPEPKRQQLRVVDEPSP